MQRSFSLWQFFGFGVTSLGGTLLHFLYDWSGQSIWTAPFSGVNESTWEHMKLLFFPLFLYACFEFFLFRDRLDFWCIKLRGTLLGLILIPVLFYTYNGVIGKSPDFINIAIFFVAAAATYWYETRLFQKKNHPCKYPCLAFAGLSLIGLSFVAFTFFTPQIGIFKDPLSGGYGIL